MKKLKIMIIALLLAIVTTGCVKFNVNMDIKKDKSMDFTMIYAFDKSLIQNGNELKESDLEEVKKNGFTITRYSDGKFEGFTISKKINNIDDVSTTDDTVYNLSGLMSSGEDSKYIFKVVKGLNKNTYYAKIKFDASDSNMSSMDSEELADEATDMEDGMDFGSVDWNNMMSSMKDMDLSFNVTLPNGAISSNADKKENDNKKLSWALQQSGNQYIEFAFELNDVSNNMLLYIGIGALVLLGVVLVLVLVKGKKSQNIPTEMK